MVPLLASSVLPPTVEKRSAPVVKLVALRLDTDMVEFTVMTLVVIVLPAKVDTVNDPAVNAGTVKLPVTTKLVAVMVDP